MPRTAVTVTLLNANAGTVEPAGTAADPTNGHSVDPAGPTDLVLIRVANTFAGAKNVTIKAGANPPALEAGQGDLVVSVPASTGVRWFGPLVSGRFIQANGLINVDLEAGMTGTVTAYRIPKTA